MGPSLLRAEPPPSRPPSLFSTMRAFQLSCCTPESIPLDAGYRDATETRPQRPFQSGNDMDKMTTTCVFGCGGGGGADGDGGGSGVRGRGRGRQRVQDEGVDGSTKTTKATTIKPVFTSRSSINCISSSLLSWSSLLMLLLLLAVSTPCSAAGLPFTNCLDTSYTAGNPPGLQFVGNHVDATLDVQEDSQNLRVTMWGNVTGSRSRNPLPASNNTAYWTDDNQTEGKILRQPNPPYVTTLHSKINVLTYEPWSNDSDFCNSLGNGRCPMSPVFDPNATYDRLPFVSMANNFTTSYAFTSWAATFIIKYTDSAVVNIGCVSATITPDLGPSAAIVRYLPVAILAFVAFATIFAAIYSPWGTTDVFRWSSNYGRDSDLIRLVTPGFGDCLQYIQFVVLTAGLTLNYPGFYQPIASQLAWSALMFNETLVTREPGYQSIQDGIYVADAPLGLSRLAKLTGMANPADVWAGMIVWVLVMIAAVIVLGELAFGVRWAYRQIKNISEEDLRSKNLPFTAGNVIRIVFNYFLLPIVALSTFQLVVASGSPAWTVALAAMTLLAIVVFAAWLLYLIVTTKPRAFLFDDLPTVLLYGPLYNTFSDEAAPFALVPLFLTFFRGITIGAVQQVGIAQIVILAICEVISIFTIIAVKPFQKPTSMNAYHSVFAAFRLVSVLLMMAFIPEIGLTEGQRGWFGYAILVIHCCVVGFGFFLNALQTTLEVAVRLSGAGGDASRGLQRGGLSKIFGMRQLQRREGVSRNSHHSALGMLDKEDISKTGFVMPSGRVRSESAGSGALLTRPQQHSSSALDYTSIDSGFGPPRAFDAASSFSPTPTTPGEASTYSFLSSPAQSRHPLAPSAGLEAAADPYYRPPRRRGQASGQDNTSPTGEKNRGSWASGDWSQRRLSQATGGPLADPSDLDAQLSRGPTPAPAAYSQPSISFAPRTDYSTREVDFYYGVRGQRLNSDAPSRKLVTGPADPTGPMASAAGWLRRIVGGKTKERGKGFEVVRSSRMPPAMKARGGDITDDAAPQGIPVAMSTLRNGPIESDDEDEIARKKRRPSRGPALLNSEGNPGAEDGANGTSNVTEEGDDDAAAAAAAEAPSMAKISDQPPLLPGIERTGSISLPSRVQSKVSRASRPPRLELDLLGEKMDFGAPPGIPRKSSKRDSGSDQWTGPTLLPVSGGQDHDRNGAPLHLAPSATSSRLPFERSDSQGGLSTGSSTGAPTEGTNTPTLQGRSPSTSSREVLKTNYGVVAKGNVSHVDAEPLVGREAELVDERT